MNLRYVLSNRMARIPDCAGLDVRILGPKRNLDHRYLFEDELANVFDPDKPCS